MAASINTDVNLNPVVSRLLESEWGLVFICIMIFLLVIGGFVYLLAKSGVMSGFTAYTEHTSKKFHKEIEYKEELLSDESLIELKDLMEYHVKVSKLENFLKFKNKDIDLLKYALYCRDSRKALKLYIRGKDFLEKDKTTNSFKLKNKMTVDKIKIREKIALIIYCLLNFIGTLPYIGQVIIIIFKIGEVNWFSLKDQLIIFIVLLVFSFIVVTFLLSPRAAQSFLELEKIPTKVDE